MEAAVGEWTHDEVKQLVDMHRTHTRAEIAEALGKTDGAVRSKCYRLGLNAKKGRPWTVEDLETIYFWYADREDTPLNLDELAKKLGRDKPSVCEQAAKMGLTNQRRCNTPDDVPVDCGYRKKSDSGRIYYTKYDDPEEAAREGGKKVAAWIEEHGHPKGFKGHTRSEEAKREISRKVRKWYREHPEEASENAQRAADTRLERYGTAGPVNVVNPYSRTNSGKREDLGGLFLRSSWEANYARYLKWLQGNDEIAGWEYEADTFVFEGINRGTRSYTPDFKVTLPDGSIEYHEVKGWMDAKSKTRLKRMAKYHPDVEIVLIDKKAYREIEKKVGPMLENWE